ncbi:MAG: hypothetical protein CMP23_01000 [Rickettsiales bacterium]|nr:hypothetical protein [Rickettsiales bacterium]|tara:strand:- start:438 stop:884 length:447 start_codon:yes stop_codon:yes gene_type:complete
MKRIIILVAIAALAAGGVLVLPVGNSHADPEKARACLDSMVSGAISSGMRVRGTDIYSAGPQSAVKYRLTLYKGMSYVLLGCADGEAVDLDMRLYDDKGELVSNDKSPDPQPFVDVDPPKTGEYALEVVVYKSSAPNTDFAVAVAYKY